MESLHEGIVIAVTDRLTKVRASRHGECENCGLCPGNNAMVLDAVNMPDAKPGQKVLVKLPETNVLKAAFITYLAPLTATAAGALAGGLLTTAAGETAGAIGQIAGGLAGLLTSLYYLRQYDKHVRSANDSMPIIIKIIEK